MLANPETTLGAVHFSLDGSNVNYIIQTNTTVSGFAEGCYSVCQLATSAGRQQSAHCCVMNDTAITQG